MINIYAPVNTLGYGIHAMNMVKTLKEMGEEYNLSPLGQQQVDPYYEPYAKEGVEKLSQFDAKSPSLFIFHDQFSHQACGNKLYTFSVFETTELPEMNRNMLNNGPTDVVLTTTQRHAELLEANGIKKPIKVINEGVDDALFNTIPYDPLIDTGKFTYITVGKREMRKGTDEIILKFVETMKDKEVALICHTFNPFLHKDQKEHPLKNLTCWTSLDPRGYSFDYKGFNGVAHHFSNGPCDIYFTAPNIPTTNLASLYHSANVGIAYSRGEGWDLPLTEMMACGVPAITTDCLGHLEYLHAAPAIQKELIVGCKGREIANDNIWFKGDNGFWDIPDFDGLADKLENTYANIDRYKEKNDELSDYITENYSWSRATQDFLTLTKEA
jgi:glycosyltransferase involved in cell wall biosynthesis